MPYESDIADLNDQIAQIDRRMDDRRANAPQRGRTPQWAKHQRRLRNLRSQRNDLSSRLDDMQRDQGAQTGNMDPEWAKNNPDEARAALTRAQWRMFEDQFRGYEDQALERGMDRGRASRAATQAETDVADAFDATGGMASRRLSRYGQGLSAEEERAANRNRTLAQAATATAAGNTARRQTREHQDALISDLGNLGQGISSSATQDLGAAGGMAAGRRQAHQQAQAAQPSTAQRTIGGAASGAAAGSAFGPWGMAGGAVIGGLTSALF